MPNDLKEAFKYRKQLKENGAILANIKNWASHWLYGTSVDDLVKLSKGGIVYNPPGH